jgi:co-chaperonin GroES (HSP10)
MTEIINGTLRMTGDRILVKPLDWNGASVHGEGSRIQVVRKGNAVRGVVVSVGPGHNPIKYKPNAMGKKAKMDYSRHFRPTEVKPGDVVELGGLNQFDGNGYQFTEVLYNGERHLICTERDVAMVREDARAA